MIAVHGDFLTGGYAVDPHDHVETLSWPFVSTTSKTRPNYPPSKRKVLHKRGLHLLSANIGLGTLYSLFCFCLRGPSSYPHTHNVVQKSPLPK